MYLYGNDKDVSPSHAVKASATKNMINNAIYDEITPNGNKNRGEGIAIQKSNIIHFSFILKIPFIQLIE